MQLSGLFLDGLSSPCRTAVRSSLDNLSGNKEDLPKQNEVAIMRFP
jgi:hypothetical protein